MNRPTMMKTQNLYQFIEVNNNRIINHSAHQGTVTADNPIPPHSNYYFEIRIEKVGIGFVAVGLLPIAKSKRTGYAFRSDGKLLIADKNEGLDWGHSQVWGEIKGDVIGCGYLYGSEKSEIFFTKNGKYIGVSHTLTGKHTIDLLPYVSIGQERVLTVHFPDDSDPSTERNGSRSDFIFDIKSYFDNKQKQLEAKIYEMPISSTLMHDMVRDYLLYHGYGKTLQALDNATDSIHNNRINHHNTGDSERCMYQSSDGNNEYKTSSDASMNTTYNQQKNHNDTSTINYSYMNSNENFNNNDNSSIDIGACTSSKLPIAIACDRDDLIQRFNDISNMVGLNSSKNEMTNTTSHMTTTMTDMYIKKSISAKEKAVPQVERKRLSRNRLQAETRPPNSQQFSRNIHTVGSRARSSTFLQRMISEEEDENENEEGEGRDEGETKGETAEDVFEDEEKSSDEGEDFQDTMDVDEEEDEGDNENDIYSMRRQPTSVAQARDSHECKKASNEDRTRDKMAKSISIKSLIYDSILSTNDSNNARTSNYEENNKSSTPINRLFGDSNHISERDGYVWGSLELRTEVRQLIMSGKIDDAVDLIQRCEEGIRSRKCDVNSTSNFTYGYFAQSPAFIFLQCYNFIQKLKAGDVMGALSMAKMCLNGIVSYSYEDMMTMVQSQSNATELSSAADQSDMEVDTNDYSSHNTNEQIHMSNDDNMHKKRLFQTLESPSSNKSSTSTAKHCDTNFYIRCTKKEYSTLQLLVSNTLLLLSFDNWNTHNKSTCDSAQKDVDLYMDKSCFAIVDDEFRDIVLDIVNGYILYDYKRCYHTTIDLFATHLNDICSKTIDAHNCKQDCGIMDISKSLSSFYINPMTWPDNM